MDENPYKSPLESGTRRPSKWTAVKRWATVVFLSVLGANGLATGVVGFIKPLPWSNGGLQSVVFVWMGLLALFAAYRHARRHWH